MRRRAAFTVVARALTVATMFSLGACVGREANATAGSQPTNGSNGERPHMKYTTVEPANALGYAKVSIKRGPQNAEGVIVRNGVEIIAPSTDFFVTDVTDARALLQFASKFLFVELDQGPVDEALFATTNGYTFAEPFRSGVALVTLGDTYFYINEDGQKQFNETYDHAETFHDDRALVFNGARKRLIDPHGKTVAVLKYDQVNQYSALRYQVTRIKGDVYLNGFVDLDGKEVVAPIYDEVTMYQDEVKRSVVGIKGKFGYIDDRGEVVIPLTFDYATIFSRGKAGIGVIGHPRYFIDPNGKEVPEE